MMGVSVRAAVTGVVVMVVVVGVTVAQEEGSGNGLAAGSEDILSGPYDPAAFSCDGQDYGYYADVASGCEVSKTCKSLYAPNLTIWF